jgi:hypothetical protein
MAGESSNLLLPLLKIYFLMDSECPPPPVKWRGNENQDTSRLTI